MCLQTKTGDYDILTTVSLTEQYDNEFFNAIADAIETVRQLPGGRNRFVIADVGCGSANQNRRHTYRMLVYLLFNKYNVLSYPRSPASTTEWEQKRLPSD